MMKKYFLLSIFLLFFINCSKDKDSETETEIITIEVIITGSDLILNIDENPENGDLLGTMQASVNSGSLSFSIINQNPEGAISIDASNGEVKVADASLFNYEVNPSLSGAIRVSSGSVNKELSYQITLIDVDEELICAGITFTTQEQINEFGNSGCTEINGSLVRGSYSNPNNSIVDLSPLSGITKVSDFLFVNGNLALETMGPLSSITGELAGIQVKGNPLLQNLEGLNGITKINSIADNEISHNESLVNFEGLNNLVEIEGFVLHIAQNSSLQNLDGLENLSTLSNGFGFNIIANHNLSNIDALQGLSYIPNLRLNYCQSLTSLEGLSNVTEMVSFTINNIPIQNLHGLRSLEKLTNGFNLIDNPIITDISDLSNLNLVDRGFSIEGNPLLQSLNGLQNIHTLRSFGINNNNSLINLDGLNINEIVGETAQGGLTIYRNNSLIDIDALSSVTTLDRASINIQGNPLITNLDGLENLVFCVQSCELKVADNTQLSDLCGLTTFASLPSPLIVSYIVEGNLYNPSYHDMLNGDCSL